MKLFIDIWILIVYIPIFFLFRSSSIPPRTRPAPRSPPLNPKATVHHASRAPPPQAYANAYTGTSVKKSVNSATHPVPSSSSSSSSRIRPASPPPVRVSSKRDEKVCNNKL